MVIPLLVAYTISGFAQQETENQVPVDERIRYGKLDNGITYYILHNEEPENRASYYLIQNVGSLLEDDNQDGLAHFLEHMAFNGTKNFPAKGIINSLEKHGVAFGYNINAYTYYYETVYNLSDVPVDPPGLIDTCLLVLHDWSDFLLLSDEEIDAERGVITEEWRTRRNAQFRMMKEYLPVLLAGSKYPDRDIIGDLEIIQNFDYETLRKFYHKWYRTDLQAIAVAGDFDIDTMEKKIVTLFSGIKAIKNPEPMPEYLIPDHSETRYVLATDPESSQVSVDLYIKNRAFSPEEKGLNYLREQYIRTLFNSMISSRINEILQKGIPPFVTGSIAYSSFLRGYDVLSIGASSDTGKDSLAFEAIYREAERVRRHGFTDGELSRAKMNLTASWDSYYKERDKIDNDTYISNMQSHFLENEPLPSIEFEYEYLKKVLPTISAGEVSSRAKTWMRADNRVIVVQGPRKEGANYLTEKGALSIIGRIDNSEIAPYEDTSSSSGLVPGEIDGGKIVSTRRIDDLDAVEWTLQNGVKVVYRHADFEKDNVTLTAFSPGGISLVSDELIPEAEMLSSLAAMYGAGEFDNVTLQKVLAGKKASLSVSLGQISDMISGSSIPDDFELMMQLLYLKFAAPRFDREAHDAIISRYKAFLSQMNNNPQKIIQDSLSLILSDYHPRTRILNSDFIDDISFESIEELYRQRFSDADDFTFLIVGNISEEKVAKAAAKYIGALASLPGSEEYVDHKIKLPDGITDKTISMPLEVPKATVFVVSSSMLEYTPKNIIASRLIKGILDLRYNETIREEEGGTYGVSTSIGLIPFPNAKAEVMITFDCEPGRTDELKRILLNEIEELCSNGPSDTDLSKSVSNLLKNREESKSHNSYWLNALYSLYYYGINTNDPSNFEEILESISGDDIKAAAQKIFKNADRVELVFVPESSRE